MQDPHEAMLDMILDEVEELAARMSRADLAQLLERRAHELPPGSPGRAAWLCHAGESWELDDEPELARTCYEEAVQDGGPVWVDPRAALVGVLVELGDTARSDQLLAELRHDLTRRELRGPVHEYVGEALELGGRLEEALRWFTAGLETARREDPERVDLGCLNGRYRVRRALGLAHDSYDALCEERRHAAQAELAERRSGPYAVPAGTPPNHLTQLYWPPAELEAVLARWPAMSGHCGADHAAHRATVEHRLRDLSANGTTVAVGSGRVEEYVEFAERGEHDPADPATRAAYAAHLGYVGRSAPWPPGRNDRCWCGSGAKYKKCCGALRFAPGTPPPPDPTEQAGRP